MVKQATPFMYNKDLQVNIEKVYQDSDGNDCTIMQMVRREPEWAANRIQEGEKAIERLRALGDVPPVLEVEKPKTLGDSG